MYCNFCIKRDDIVASKGFKFCGGDLGPERSYKCGETSTNFKYCETGMKPLAISLLYISDLRNVLSASKWRHQILFASFTNFRWDQAIYLGNMYPVLMKKTWGHLRNSWYRRFRERMCVYRNFRHLLCFSASLQRHWLNIDVRRSNRQSY